MKKNLMLIIVAVILGSCDMEKQYQHDADIMRLRHLKYYVDLLKEYKKQTGHWPFQSNSNIQTYVNILNDWQYKLDQSPPFSHRKYSVCELHKEIEAGINRKVLFKFDPQRKPVGRPNFYVYMTEDTLAFFSVHLSKPLCGATQLGESYFKIEVTNGDSTRPGTLNMDCLLNSEAFKQAISENLYRDKWFNKIDIEDTAKWCN
jgi:hypothetical protein